MNYSFNKGLRLIKLYEILQRGEGVSKKQLMEMFRVTEKTVQRDIADLRIYLAEEGNYADEEIIKYNRQKNEYYLTKFQREWLRSSEIMAVCKVLIESRGFCKEELDALVDKLMKQVEPLDSKLVTMMIRNEKHFYEQPKHGKRMMDKLWEMSKYVMKKNVIQIEYETKVGKETAPFIKPMAIMFSEYYFYLIAYIADESEDVPVAFRIDRIKKITEINKKSTIPSEKNFSEGEFRKRVSFMYTGKLNRIKFRFSGPSLEAIQDRIPTVEIVEEEGNGSYILTAESYGSGMEMWLRTQGDWVEML